MKFVDEAFIDVASGDGGAGCVSFRHEKYKEFAAPAKKAATKKAAKKAAAAPAAAKPAPAPASATQTTLNPQAAWPFPTASKP
jgi:hypothetical protein